MSNMSQIRELPLDVNCPKIGKLYEWSSILNVRVRSTIKDMQVHDENMDKHITRSSIKKIKKSKLAIMKNIRGIYLYINRSKHTVFTFYKMNLWKTFSIKRNQFIDQLYDVKSANIYNWNNKEIKYIELIIKTLNNYEDYGKFISCVINKLFYYDIAWQILDYI